MTTYSILAHLCFTALTILHTHGHTQALQPIGYFANAKKTWLLVKESSLSVARDLFKGTEVNVITEGRPYLGAPLGTSQYIEGFVQAKVDTWRTVILSLTEIASSQPHTAYSAFTHGLSNLWLFLCRTTPNIHHLLEPLEETIRTNFIPTLTGRAPPNDIERKLFSLPARLGGLNIISPSSLSREYEASQLLTSSLRSLILAQSFEYPSETWFQQIEARSSISQSRRLFLNSEADSLSTDLPDDLRFAVLLAQEKGASSWLTSLPILEYGHALHKGAFRDALALRYGWLPSGVPSECVCGKAFSVEHALSCSRGGFPTLRHNEVRDLTASLLTEVCSNVALEPELQHLSGEVLRGGSANRDNGARLDIAVDGFWSPGRERTFVDIRVFNPFAPANRRSSLASTYRMHEKEKRRCYCQRVTDVEHGSFCPLVFSLTGGTAKEATVFYKRLASLLSEKWDQPYSTTINWLRVSLGFSLLKSSIRCIRGARSAQGRPVYSNFLPVDVIQSESCWSSQAA